MWLLDFSVKYYDYRPFKVEFANKLLGNLSKFLGWLANKVLPIIFKISDGKKKYYERLKSTKSSSSIVCLTSFPRRISTVPLVLECLLRQTMPVQEVVLFLSELQFPNKEKDLPLNLLLFKDIFLKIVWVKEDVRSHKKYWYALRSFPDRSIITLDDDIIYSSKAIEKLEALSSLYHGCVPCLYAHKILWDANGSLKPYLTWLKNATLEVNQPIENGFFGSGGGTLFPVGSLKDADQELSTIMEVCPLADDIWLNAFVRKNGYRIVTPKFRNSVLTWSINDNSTLSSVNVGHNQNDSQLVSVSSFMKSMFGVTPFEMNFFANIKSV